MTARFLPLAAWRPSLHTRVGLLLAGVVAGLFVVFAGFWAQGTRAGIHEEVEAATRVSEQMLKTLAAGRHDAAELLAVVAPLGRIRAHELEVRDPAGALLYRSPAPTYKAGRSVPAWFARLIAPQFASRELPAADVVLVLKPDPSRAVIDAWDDLVAMSGWGGLLLALVFGAARLALFRALRPLDQVMAALDRTGAGRFDARLPIYAPPELARLAHAFNGMADRLGAAVDENVRLETEREVAERMHDRLAAERREIARELHDELAQGITAVRALAGAVIQRAEDSQPAVAGYARHIVAATGDLQEGVRSILHRLHQPADGLPAALERLTTGWRLRHEAIALDCRIALGSGTIAAPAAQAVLRVVQEGLTNVARHSGARRAELSIVREGDAIVLRLDDDGHGLRAGSAQAGCGLGLAGMRERVAGLGGSIELGQRAGGGCRLVARWPANREVSA